MEKVPQFIIDNKDDEIAIVEDTDLKNLFNLSYSFDLLQSTITLLFKIKKSSKIKSLGQMKSITSKIKK